MNNNSPTWAVFTKPWGDLPATTLAPMLADLGFTGVELPVRPGFEVTPANAATELPRVVAILAESGLATISVAADPSEEILAGCAAAGVDLVRVMAPVTDHDWTSSLTRMREQLASWVEWAAPYGVRIGVQPHHGAWVSTVLGVQTLAEGFGPEQVGIVWDAAHDALAGEDPVTTLTLSGDRLMLVNLKNARYLPRDSSPHNSGPPKTWFGPGSEGLADWPAVIGHLRTTGWDGAICLTAQYNAAQGPDDHARMVGADLAWAQQLWYDVHTD